jgi:hypothetical protein
MVDSKRTTPYYVTDRFEIGPGYALMIWPDRMTAEELRDFNDWLDLMKRKINRIAAPAQEYVDRSMNEGAGDGQDR